MESTDQGGYVVPNVRIPKVVGILNIVFASGILLCGLCTSVYIAMMPGLLKATVTMQKEAVKRFEEEQKADLKKLEDAEQVAKTDEEKAEIEKERIEVRSRPKPNFGFNDPTALGFDDPKLKGFMWLDMLTSVVLNVMMLVAGIALVNRKPLGIKLGLWTAGLKILRLIAIYSIFAIAIVPPLAQGMAKLAIQAMNAQVTGKPMPPTIDQAFFVRTYTVTYTVMAVGMILVGSIYPIITLWLLSRPGARAACSGVKLPDEGLDAW
jgi:hypothetical protein